MGCDCSTRNDSRPRKSGWGEIEVSSSLVSEIRRRLAWGKGRSPLVEKPRDRRDRRGVSALSRWQSPSPRRLQHYAEPCARSFHALSDGRVGYESGRKANPIEKGIGPRCVERRWDRICYGLSHAITQTPHRAQM